TPARSSFTARSTISRTRTRATRTRRSSTGSRRPRWGAPRGARTRPQWPPTPPNARSAPAKPDALLDRRYPDRILRLEDHPRRGRAAALALPLGELEGAVHLAEREAVGHDFRERIPV